MEEKYCIVCGTKLSGRQSKYCSTKCKRDHFNSSHRGYNTKYSKKRDEEGILLKLELVKSKGGKCEICGYNKNFTLTSRNISRKSKEEIMQEVSKCKLLCSNCHQELHHPHMDLDIVESKNTPSIHFRTPTKKSNLCIDCGEEISPNAIRCFKCSKIKSRKIENRPNKDELFSMMSTMSVISIAKKFNVSDNTIRKWCKYYNIPFRKSEYK